MMKRLCIMLSPELGAWARAEAKREGVSFNEICRRGVEALRRQSSEGGIFDFNFVINADVPADFSVRPERAIEAARQRKRRKAV